jgi:hypothetical protein
MHNEPQNEMAEKPDLFVSRQIPVAFTQIKRAAQSRPSHSGMISG